MINTFSQFIVYPLFILIIIFSLSYATPNVNDVEIIVFPGLNHLFIKSDGPSRPEAYMEPGNVAPEVIQTIVNWIERIEN